MWQKCLDREKFIPPDSGEVVTQPDLSLSVQEILERWKRNEPLDVVTRNGSFVVEDKDVDVPGDDSNIWNMIDPDQGDLLDIEEHIAATYPAKSDTRSGTQANNLQQPSESVADAAEGSEAQRSEPKQ